jgi:uncharacterized membrane protein
MLLKVSWEKRLERGVPVLRTKQALTLSSISAATSTILMLLVITILPLLVLAMAVAVAVAVSAVAGLLVLLSLYLARGPTAWLLPRSEPAAMPVSIGSPLRGGGR